MVLLLAKHIKNELLKEAVKALSDEDKLMEIVKDDEYIFEIRQLAAKQITNNDYLKEIIFDTSETTYTKNLFDIREIAVYQIRNEETLNEIVTSYFDETIDTKYELNIVIQAVKQIDDEEMLLNIAENKYDEKITNLALEKINVAFDNEDEGKLIEACNDDIKVKRLHAIDQIDDDEILFDIAMNAKYLDVREKALNKIKVKDESVLLLNNLIQKEKEYHEVLNDYMTSDEENEENKQEIINKANHLGVEYKSAGNPEKEKFYNEQCKLFKNN